MLGVMIQMMGVLLFNKSIDLFDNEVLTISARCKSNSLKLFDHHGAKGLNYSFDDKPLYGNSDGLSVSTYVQLKRKNK